MDYSLYSVVIYKYSAVIFKMSILIYSNILDDKAKYSNITVGYLDITTDYKRCMLYSWISIFLRVWKKNSITFEHHRKNRRYNFLADSFNIDKMRGQWRHKPQLFIFVTDWFHTKIGVKVTLYFLMWYMRSVRKVSGLPLYLRAGVILYHRAGGILQRNPHLIE